MRYLSNKEMKELRRKLEEFGIETNERLIQDKIENSEIIRNNKFVVAIVKDNELIPCLRFKPTLKGVSVDKNAIKFIINGADVMRPGIIEIEEFKKGDIIAVKALGNTIGIGKALFSSEEMKEMEKGKVVKNLHYTGDKFWNTTYN